MEFTVERINDALTRITALNTECVYLVQGTDRAALLDSGSGFCSLKAVVDRLTTKPVLVLLTHGHTDHAMGAGEFSTVYMDPSDRDVFLVHGARSFRWKSMELSPAYRDLTEADYIPTADADTFHPLHAGDVFDLGGQHIEIFSCPGHTKGSVCMLLREQRLLLLGDACNGLTFLFDAFSTGVRTYRGSLLRLKADTDGKYDGVLLSHTGGKPYSDMIESNLAVCDDILSGNTDDQPFTFMGQTALLAKAFSFERGRLDGGHGNIVFCKETKQRQNE